jgi:Zn-dependent peptidase ImmA (M78 family)/DNA-binding XRE family transcriptional regulator
MNHFAERLKNARKMRGFSLQDLSEVMNLSISKQNLSRLESGIMKPDSEMLSRLSAALKVTGDYFFRKNAINLEQIAFRKLQRLPAREKEMVKTQTMEFLERYMELESLLGLDHKMPFTPHEYKINPGSEQEDIEVATRVLREERLKIGNDPIYNVYELLEENNIKVYPVLLPPSFSGMSTIINDQIGVIVFNDFRDIPKVRKRFTLLHELAHLFLDLSAFDEKKSEMLCDNFAGAMLLPQQRLIDYFGGKREEVYINELKLIKEYFGISLSAIMYRAKNLDLISEHHLKYFFIRYNKYYKEKEQEGYEGKEKSNRFIQLLLRAVAQDVISTTKAAVLNNQKLGDFREQYLDVNKDEDRGN